MKLTKKKAIEISIELWEWLAETGDGNKANWSGWKKYGGMVCDCALCEYSTQQGGIKGDTICDFCPLYTQLGNGCYEFGYCEWEMIAETVEDRKEYARLFLAQLRELK